MDGLLRFALFVTIAVAPLGWLTLVEVGPLQVRPMHVAFGLLTVCALLRSPRLFFTGIIARSPMNWMLLFSLAYAAWMFSYLPSGKVDPLEGVSQVFKFPIYCLSGASMVGAFYVARVCGVYTHRRACQAVVFGCMLFCVIAIIIFAQKGENLIVSYSQDVMTGNMIRLQFYYYKVLFEGTGSDEHINLRNTLMGAFVLYVMLAYPETIDPNPRHRWFAYFTVFVSSVIVILSVNRSNAFALLAAMGTASLIYNLQAMRRLVNIGIILGILGIGAVGAVVLFVPEVATSVTDRFGTQVVNNVRVENYMLALDGAATGTWDGAGPATHVLTREGPLRVHNLILAALFETGIVGFILASAMYICLILTFYQLAMKSLRCQTSTAALSFASAAGLLMLPSFCMMLSGEAGIPTFVEWTSMAISARLLDCPQIPLNMETTTG
jgi:O-antigen ligase